MTHSTEWSQRDRTVWHQMSGHPAPGKGPIIIAEGDGAWVTDTNGNRYLDGLSGQWCVNVGYGRSRLAEAAARQLETLAFHPLTRGHIPAIELSERLEELLGGRRASYYANSGSEANELAFKLVRQYHQLRGEPSSSSRRSDSSIAGMWPRVRGWKASVSSWRAAASARRERP